MHIIHDYFIPKKYIYIGGLGPPVPRKKKVQKQDLKNIKNVKRCRDGMPKVCKQGRDDIIVKVNLQSPIPTITVAN